MRRTAACFLPLIFLAVAALTNLVAQQNTPKYLDFKLSPETRAADLVSRLTLEEKVEQMQNSAPSVPRLNIPAYDWWNEALHGVARAGYATVFPQAIGLAATWDTDLESRLASAISTEARAKYNDAVRHGNHGRYYGLTFWSPNINIFRDPRWGRGQETYGEDPYLTSRMGVAFIKAMQGDDPKYFKTIATAKHFAVHSGPESSRHRFDVNPSDFDLQHTYLPAFQATITEAKADSVMCAYNRLRGAPACASTFLLQDTLRQAWHFEGYVVSDCGAVQDIYDGHHYTDSLSQAAAKAVKAGTDLTCGREYRTLTDAVINGSIKESEIDESLRRLFVARFRLGLFDPPDRVPYSKLNLKDVQTPEHQKLSLEAAAKSLVLLKNDGGILPLKKSFRRIAVVGPAADDPDTLLGNYNGIPAHIVTPLAGIQQQFGSAANVRFALGSTYVSSATALVPRDVLSPQTGSGGGLSVEYFANANFSGKPVLARVEPRQYFVWDMSEPAIVKAVPREAFSARWSGTITAPQTGDYQLGVVRAECHTCGRSDFAQLYLDDHLIADDRQQVTEAMYPKIATVRLEAGKPHHIRIDYAQTGGGGGVQLVWRPPADAALVNAVNLVKDSDMAILCIGLNPHLEGEESSVQVPGFSGGDRTSIDLPEPQEKLLNAILATGKPVVVVLINGSALAIRTAKARANAILEAWYPGQEGGTAIASALAGALNPAGRLPVTFYESSSQLPAFDDYSMKGRTYRYFSGKPLYPFGYGLTYSDFRYSGLSVKPDEQGSKWVVTGTVKNESSVPGDEVAQVYLSRQDGSSPELRAFQRIHLAAGEQKQLQFSIDRNTTNGDSQEANFVSLGGGQPRRDWTGPHYQQIALR